MSCDQLKNIVTEKLAVMQADLAQRSKNLSESFKEEAKNIDPDLNTDGPDAWLSADIDIQWKTVELSLDLPEVKLVDQEWSLDLPQVTVKDQNIGFDLPAVRMVRTKTGEYPEFYCDTHTLIPQCTIRYSPIWVDLPEIYMERHDIVMGVPEFTMSRVSFILGVPEVTMRTTRFALDLPQITFKDIKVEAAKARDKAQNLSVRANAESEHLKKSFTEEAKMTVGFDVNQMFDCFENELQTRKNDAVAMFSSGEAAIRAGINSMVTQKVPEDNVALVGLRKQLDELLTKTGEFTNSIAKQFADFDEQRKKFIKNLLGE